MMRPELLKMLVCPETRSELSLADGSLVERLNQAIAAGNLTNKIGKPVPQRLDGALVRADGAVAYPIVDAIPMLLVDEGIPLDQPALRS